MFQRFSITKVPSSFGPVILFNYAYSSSKSRYHTSWTNFKFFRPSILWVNIWSPDSNSFSRKYGKTFDLLSVYKVLSHFPTFLIMKACYWWPLTFLQLLCDEILSEFEAADFDEFMVIVFIITSVLFFKSYSANL